MTSQYQVEDVGEGTFYQLQTHMQTRTYTEADGKVTPRSEVHAPATHWGVTHVESLQRERSQVY